MGLSLPNRGQPLDALVLVPNGWTQIGEINAGDHILDVNGMTCVVLSVTDNRFGAISGILLVGAAFAPIYPLVVEKIGHRFPDYHPGFFNGIFSFAMAGGLLAPCLLGYFASYWGVGVVMSLPLAGSVVVFLLLMLIGLEARLRAGSGERVVGSG